MASGRHVVQDLNGKTINRNRASGSPSGWVIVVGGNLTITGNGTITGGYVSGNHGGGVYVNGGTFTMQGGTISGNSAGFGGGVEVSVGTVFNMTGGTIGGNKEADRNTAPRGGGVYVGTDGTFNMSGGTISGNTANSEGGGVYMFSSSDNMICKFTMSGGTINGNTATKGGGVYVDRNSEFTMNDGTVSGNNANSGGGVYMSSGTFTMSGGAISNNTADSYGGGMYKGGGTFKLSGKVEISGNKRGSNANNVVLSSTTDFITVQGKIENTKPIGVSFTSGDGTFTSGFKANMPDADPADFFESEWSGYGVLWNSDKNEAMLARAVAVTFNNNISSDPKTKKQYVELKTETALRPNPFTRAGYRFTGWNTGADGKGTAYTDGQKVTLTANLELYAQWEQIEVGVDNFDVHSYEYTSQPIEPAVYAWDKKTQAVLVKDKDFTVVYKNNKNAGGAEATITFIGDYEGVAEVTKPFEITPKPLWITPNDQTKVQGEADPELTYVAKGLVGGDTLSGKLSREAGEEPGTYKILRGDLSAGDNYGMIFHHGATLTITAKPDEDKPTGAGDIDTEVEKGEDVPEMKVGGLTDETAKDLATKEELDRVEKGEKLVVYLTATNIDDTVSKADKALVTAAITAKDKGGKVAQYLDFSMFKQIGKDKPTRLTDLKGHAITIIITVPKAFRAPAGVKRTFYVVRVHDGEAQIVGTGTGASVKVSTDKFSTYALTYVDETEPEPEPEPKPTVKPTVKAGYTLLGQLTVSGSGNKTLKMSWTKVKDADGYDVYFARCGKDFKLKASVAASASRCVRFTGLKKRESYKAYVRAWKKVNGKKVYIGKKSPELHAITGGYDKDYCNTKSVKLSRSALTLKVGKSKTIRASLKGVKSKRKVLDHVRKVRWYSSNVNVVAVDSNGKVKATGKGACTVYAIANNGIRNSVKVTVK